MIQLGISDISKNPSLIDKVDDLIQILNKKTKKVKGVFIPNALLSNFEEIFEEIEYKKFIQRNKDLQSLVQEDNTLLDGLDNAY